MKTHTPAPEEMLKRVARFKELVPYGRLHADSGIPSEVFENLTARNVYSIVAPTNYKGRSAAAPIKCVPGAVMSFAECPPGNAPALHAHETAYESFLCLNGKFRIFWGDEGEYHVDLEPLDFISIPPGVNRTFVNISDETARLFAIIQPGDASVQEDPVAFATSVGRKLTEKYGPDMVPTLQGIGFHFNPGTTE